MDKKCLKCELSFEITDENQLFYQEVGVTLPTLCPDCRNIRRMSWRNDRSFYKRNCDGSKKSFISIYPENTVFPVFHPDYWYGDKWNPLDYGQEYDFSKTFFQQFENLMRKVPRLGIDIVNCENSYYCNYCGDDKNCYLDIAGEGNEDSYFNLFTKYSKDTVDCTFVYNSENCYECLNCYKCHTVFYSKYLENCNNCFFCFDLKGCKNCIFSSNLRQKEYYIYNKPYSKEEYENKLKEIKLSSYANLPENISQWKKITLEAIHRDMYNLNSENCIGNDIKNSKNCYYSFNISNCEDSKYLYDVLDAKDCYDLNYSLYEPEKSYELISTLAMKFSAFCMASHYCSNSYYLDLCNNSSYLFGCIGLNHKKYCILNKQYTEEEYNNLVPKIIEHMKSSGEFSEFFPSEISPFKYSETVAEEYFSQCQSDIVTKRQSEHDSNEIPDDINEVDESICEKILTCEESGKPYKIIPQELKFYKKMGLPIPRVCPQGRHKKRMELRNPRKLFIRQCMKCEKEIKTTYSQKRPEIIYCESCYLKEVY